VTAHLDPSEPKPPADPDSPFTHTMEGWPGPRPPALVTEFWSPGWNSIQALNRFQEEIAGPLRDGDPGVRLLEPADGAAPPPGPAGAPAPGTGITGDELRLVPLHHIFGSEELSALAPGVATRVPDPYVALHPADAGRRGLADGSEARVIAGESSWALPVRLRADLPEGVVGLPRGLPGLAGPPLPERCRVEKGGSA
jgi:NADH-quinone oxidoreductase subunit G